MNRHSNPDASPVEQKKKTLLCIDDYPDGLKIRKAFLETFGFVVLTAEGGRTGLAVLEHSAVDAVLLDYRMPEMNGGEVAKIIREKIGALPILMLSGYTSEIPEDVLHLIDAFVPKGASPLQLLEKIRVLLGAHPSNVKRKSSEQLIDDSKKQVQRSRDIMDHHNRKYAGDK